MLYNEHKISQNTQDDTKPRGIEQTTNSHKLRWALSLFSRPDSSWIRLGTYHVRLIGDDDVEQLTLTTMKDSTSGVTTAPLGIDWRRFFSHRRQRTTTTASTLHRRTLNTEHQLHRRSTASASSRSNYCRQYYCKLDNITADSTTLRQADPYCITLSCPIKAAHMTVWVCCLFDAFSLGHVTHLGRTGKTWKAEKLIMQVRQPTPSNAAVMQ